MNKSWISNFRNTIEKQIIIFKILEITKSSKHKINNTKVKISKI